jgi:antitoxin component of MazEF toxin-antitoxin module
MKTEIRLIDGDLFIVIPEIFIKSLKWHKGDAIDIELVDGTLLMSKI